MILEPPSHVDRNGGARLGLVFSLTLLSIIFLTSGVSAQEIRSGWTLVDSGTDSNLLASETHDGEIWAFGDSGVMIRSVDEGRTWEQADKLTDRDLTASDSNFGTLAVAGDGGSIIVMIEGTWGDFSQPDLFDEMRSAGGVGHTSLTAIPCRMHRIPSSLRS